MPAAADDLVIRVVWNVGPLGLAVAGEPELGDLLVALMVEASGQVHSAVAVSQSRVLSRRWDPVLVGHDGQLRVEGLSLLHSLDVGLQTSGQLLGELVSWDVVTGVGNEELWCVIIVIANCLHDLEVRLLPGPVKFSVVNLGQSIFELLVHARIVVEAGQLSSSASSLRTEEPSERELARRGTGQVWHKRQRPFVLADSRVLVSAEHGRISSELTLVR